MVSVMVACSGWKLPTESNAAEKFCGMLMTNEYWPLRTPSRASVSETSCHWNVPDFTSSSVTWRPTFRCVPAESFAPTSLVTTAAGSLFKRP